MSRTSTTAWIVGAVVIAGAGVGVAAHAVATSDRPIARASATATPTGATVTTAPTTPSTPTAAPDPEVTSEPSSPTAPSPAASTPANAVKKVVPAMSYYAFSGTTLTLGGGVSGLVDAGGTCTVAVTDGSTTVEKSFAASAGPSSTDCGAMSLSSPRFTGGTWNLTLSYRSTKAVGVSAVTEVAP